MISGDISNFQQRWGGRIGQDALAKRVIAMLWRHREDYIVPVLDFARAQNPIIDPVIRSEPELMAQHTIDHFQALLSLPSVFDKVGDGSAEKDPLLFVVQHGIRRAQAGVPLRAVLQAYRSGHKSFWSIICKMIDQLAPNPETGMRTTMLLSDYCIEYTDLISVAVSDAYVAEGGSIAADRLRVASAVIEQLLNGEVPELEQGVMLCERMGLGDGKNMVVLVARDVASSTSLLMRERRELGVKIEALLVPESLGRLVECRPHEVVAIVSCLDSPGRSVADALRAEATKSIQDFVKVGRIGIGLDVTQLVDIKHSYDEAIIALELAGAQPAIRLLSEVDVNVYFRYKADRTARRLMPVLPLEVTSPPLSMTVLAFASSNLNVKACARQLRVHSNTIYHRLNRVQELTGLDPRNFAALLQIVTALETSNCEFWKPATLLSE